MIGTIGHVTCFSFYSTKTITTGEGGMAVTDDDALAGRMRVMSLHGISKNAWTRYTASGSWYYEILAPGFKYNMTDLAASLGIAQLRKADEFHRRRQAIARRYTAAFARLPEFIETPADPPSGGVHSWHLYIIKLRLDHLTSDRDMFIEELRSAKIGTSVHFIPLHIHPYYREAWGYRPEDFPRAYATYRRVISLPLYPAMTDADVDSVIDEVVSICRKHGR
jgi:dTDP-4-amino-4,6-dideoxygalactose transaminase